MEGQADPQHAAGDAGDLHLRGRPTSEAVEATAAISASQTGAVYDLCVKSATASGQAVTFVQ